MVIALCNQPSCISSGLGKAYWEVPVGTSRKEGFETLRAIARSGYPYPKVTLPTNPCHGSLITTQYLNIQLEMPSITAGGGGPNQNLIETKSDYLQKNYPEMEYWKSCSVVSKNIAHHRPLKVDHAEPVEENPMIPSSTQKPVKTKPSPSKKKEDFPSEIPSTVRIKLSVVIAEGISPKDVVIEVSHQTFLYESTSLNYCVGH